MEAVLCDGREDLEVVGESHYQDSLWRHVGGRGLPEERVRVDMVAVLVSETDNPYDANAVAVWIGGLKVGYLSRADAQRYQPGLLALQRKHGKPIALAGVIVGGGCGPMARWPDEADEADDSYNLGWINDLPADDIRAITVLRKFLVREFDPVDRHFMYAHLEALLYRSRDAFLSALDEYDETCRLHDAEMDNIRQALVAKWGQVPVLNTYRQMAIRHQKARNFERALWWAERGIVLYGADAARQDAVDDLRKRADASRRKLEPSPQSSGPKISPPRQPEIETLHCANCGRSFQRTRMPGRKPLQCPDCRNERNDE